MAQLEQRQREADVVVQVPGRLHHPVAQPEERRRHVLRRGLAGAARDRHDARPRLPPHPPRQALQRAGAVGHHDQRPAGDRVLRQVAHRAAHHDAPHAPAAERRLDEVVAVEPVAANRDEEVAGLQRPRVDRDAGTPAPRRLTRHEPAAGHGLDDVGGGRASWRPPLASPPRRVLRQRLARHRHVVERDLASPITWYFSWPFPAISTTSSARARLDGPLDGELAVGDRQVRRRLRRRVLRLPSREPRRPGPLGRHRHATPDFLDDPRPDPRSAGCPT